MLRAIDITAADLPRLSQFVDEVWRRWSDAPQPDEPVSTPALDTVLSAPESTLRRYRQLASTHLLWRDLSGQASIENTGQAISKLARDCIELALIAATHKLEADFGVLRDSDGEPIQLAVLGLGKLGGDELNFNSDIDLVFIYRANGKSDGRRALDAASYLKRVAIELIRLLDAITAEGRVWIVDTRLRPFGNAGALVWSLGAIEQYFLNEARSWERFAWMKAAPVAGDHKAANALLSAIQPFIFRRYLDYGIFQNLRDLHDQIDAKSRQESRHDDIKRGAGGIRECEFLVQSQQMLRGGRDPDLQARGFLPALDRLMAAAVINNDDGTDLRMAYEVLRILENRLQAMSGRQSHYLPDCPAQQERLLELMGHSSWSALMAEIDQHRQRVRSQFRAHFEDRSAKDANSLSLWPPGNDLEQRLNNSGFDQASEVAALLQGLHKRIADRALSAEGRQRLERLMPRLLLEVTKYESPEQGLSEILQLIDQISRRSAYLALLYERPATLERLVQVFRYSARLAEWIVAAPQLLDDLLDPVHGMRLPALPNIDTEDHETSLFALGRWRQASFLRTALAEIDGNLSAVEAANQLSQVASNCINCILDLLNRDAAPLAIIAYGNLGAGLLHFDSDLDLVFLHAEGSAPLRVAQRFLSYMQLPLPGGRLFEIDTRLRPNGSAGALVSSIEHFARYQSKQAENWEHQALIRARWVAGDEALKSRYERVRIKALTVEQDQDDVRAALAQMRERQKLERSETPVKSLLTDLQFIAECGVLCKSNDHHELLATRRPDELLDLLGELGWINAEIAKPLSQAWRDLLVHRHHQWLSRTDDRDISVKLEALVAHAWSTTFEPTA